MEAQGKVIAILESRSGVSKAGREWMSQEYVIETPGQYPKRICFNLFGADRINEAHIQMGEDIIIEFDIDAREWQGRWFNELGAWGVIEYMDSTTRQANIEAAKSQQQASEQTSEKTDQPQQNGEKKDDLPF